MGFKWKPVFYNFGGSLFKRSKNIEIKNFNGDNSKLYQSLTFSYMAQTKTN